MKKIAKSLVYTFIMCTVFFVGGKVVSALGCAPGDQLTTVYGTGYAPMRDVTGVVQCQGCYNAIDFYRYKVEGHTISGNATISDGYCLDAALTGPAYAETYCVKTSDSMSKSQKDFTEAVSRAVKAQKDRIAVDANYAASPNLQFVEMQIVTRLLYIHYGLDRGYSATPWNNYGVPVYSATMKKFESDRIESGKDISKSKYIANHASSNHGYGVLYDFNVNSHVMVRAYEYYFAGIEGKSTGASSLTESFNKSKLQAKITDNINTFVLPESTPKENEKRFTSYNYDTGEWTIKSLPVTLSGLNEITRVNGEAKNFKITAKNATVTSNHNDLTSSSNVASMADGNGNKNLTISLAGNLNTGFTNKVEITVSYDVYLPKTATSNYVRMMYSYSVGRNVRQDILDISIESGNETTTLEYSTNFGKALVLNLPGKFKCPPRFDFTRVCDSQWNAQFNIGDPVRFEGADKNGDGVPDNADFWLNMDSNPTGDLDLSCIVNENDYAASSYTEKINDYCTISCAEEYRFSMPQRMTIEDAKGNNITASILDGGKTVQAQIDGLAGGYFTLNETKLRVARVCVTLIDQDKYASDMSKLTGSARTEATNKYNACFSETPAKKDKLKVEPVIEYKYADYDGIKGKMVENSKIEKSTVRYCTEEGSSINYNCSNGVTSLAGVNKSTIKTIRHLERYEGYYYPENSFQIKHGTGEVVYDFNTSPCYMDGSCSSLELGQLPIKVNTLTGKYNYNFKFYNLGQNGRLDEISNNFEYTGVSTNNKEVKTNMQYVCFYYVKNTLICPGGNCVRFECNPSIQDCDEKLEYQYLYRSVSLNDLFPNSAVGVNANSVVAARAVGENWDPAKSEKAEASLLSIEQDKYDKADGTYAGSNVYKQTPQYSVTLTPANMRAIRKYNATKEAEGKGYADNSLKCSDSDDISFTECLSDFLRNPETVGCTDCFDKITINEKDLFTSWTGKTGTGTGPAWK